MSSVSNAPTSGQGTNPSSIKPNAALTPERVNGAGNGNGNGDDDDDDDNGPPSSRGARFPLGPQFAVRIVDGAMLMAVKGHAEDRDLSGREVWTAFVLTAREAALARQTIDHAEHEVAAHIAVKMPKRKPE